MSITESDLIRICLNRISYNYPDIPKIPESSAFDDAADAFSKIFGLAENDSSAFFARLNVLHNSISKANILYSAIEQIEDIPAQFPGELRRDRRSRKAFADVALRRKYVFPRSSCPGTVRNI